jgi:hypothetical protein
MALRVVGCRCCQPISTNPVEKRTIMSAKLLSRRVLSLAVTAMILGGGLVAAKAHLIGAALACGNT